MDAEQIDIVKDSFRVVAFRAAELGEQFFTRLFREAPEMRALFPQDAWQRDHDFASGLGVLMKNLHRIEGVAPLLEDAGVRCQRAGVQPHQFGVARDVLLHTLRDMVGQDWTSETEAAWFEVLNVASAMMIRACGRARLRAA